MNLLFLIKHIHGNCTFIIDNNCYHIVKSYNRNIKAEFTLKKTLVILYDGMCLGNNKFEVKYLSIIGYNYQI